KRTKKRCTHVTESPIRTASYTPDHFLYFLFCRLQDCENVQKRYPSLDNLQCRRKCRIPRAPCIFFQRHTSSSILVSRRFCMLRKSSSCFSMARRFCSSGM